MIPNMLLPRYFKIIGLIMVVCGYLYASTYAYDPDDVTHIGGLLIQVSVLLGYLMIAGAQEKTEDEMVRHIRLVSLQWSVFILIALRVFHKIMAFCTADSSWLPQWQLNALLLFYLVLFYYQMYAKDFFEDILKSRRK